MEVLYYTNESEEQLNYLNNRFWKIKYQYDYRFSFLQKLRFSKFSNKKVFKTINIILLGLTILIWLFFLKKGYRADLIIRISIVLFIRFFWLLLKIGILILDNPFFKAEIREKWIIIHSQCVAYDVKEISNIEMEKYYDGGMPSIKFTISNKDGIKHYYYRPSDNTIEKFCTDSILYYKKKNINIKIPIDNREPTSYETRHPILDYWLLLSEDERWEVKKYLWKWIFAWLWIALFIAIMLFLSSKDSGSKVGIGAFLFFWTIFTIIHIITFLEWFKSHSAEIMENKIIISKPNWSRDYIKCSSITDAQYKYFKKDGIEWIKLAIVYDWKGSAYTWLRSSELERFCNDVVDIAKNNKKFYSKINSSDYVDYFKGLKSWL